jgi:hypothetical protein
MTFLAPLFLLGALAIAGPIIAHLIRRSTKEQTPFSSLMFLQPTPPRVTRRSRLENLWLLLLRCLVILLLALSFGRPLWQQAAAPPPAPDERKRSILLVDTSASMRRGDLWKNAQARVEALVKKAAPTDEVALLSFGRSTTPLVSFDQWRSTPVDERVPMLLQRLQTTQPTWATTNLGSAMLEAAELLDAGRDAQAHGEIVLISDLQEGAKLDGLQGFGWPKGIRVVLEPVQTDLLDNASVQWLSDQSAAMEGKTKLRLRVQSGPEAKREQYRVQWQPPAPATAGVDVYVPAGQGRIAHAPPPPQGADKVLLTGDKVDFDNTLFVVPPEPAKIVVLFIGKDQPNDPQGALYYLHRGFPSTAQQVIQVVARPADPPPSAFELQQARLLVLGEGLTEAAIGVAREVAKSGRIVIYPVASASAAPAMAALLGVPQVKVEEAPGGKYALFGSIDFTHPVFVPFADPRYSDFTKIRFWAHRKLSMDGVPEAKVVARFDDQSPALVQVPVGRGSIVVLATTWRPSDSQLALSSKFVPLLLSLLEQSNGTQVRRAQYFVGDTVPMADGPQGFKVRAPSGKETEVAAAGMFTATDEPGVYSITPGDARFVVNLSPEESRVQPMDAGRLAALGVPLQEEQGTTLEKAAPTPAAIQTAEIENRQKLWRWLLLGAVAVLLLETPIAAKLSQVPRQPLST